MDEENSTSPSTTLRASDEISQEQKSAPEPVSEPTPESAAPAADQPTEKKLTQDDIFAQAVVQPIQATTPTTDSENTSGTDGTVPDEIKGWNWGAFFLNWIWSIGNSVWIGLLALISPITLIVAIVLGIKGNEWAWQKHKFQSVEQFKQVQKSWSIAGLILFIIGVVMTVIYFIFFSAVFFSTFFKSNNNTSLNAPYQSTPSNYSAPSVPGAQDNTINEL